MRHFKIFLALLLVLVMLTPVFYIRTDAASSSEIKYFLETLGPMATQDMRETGVLASLTIAQGIYESGWGTSWMAKNINNLFGIKAYEPGWQGKVYCRKTSKIYVNFADAKNKLGDYYKECTGQFFRVYDSWAESVRDHSALFTTMSRYENLIGVTDYKVACRLVMEDGYNESDDYADMLIRIIEQYKLYQYDVAEGIASIDMGVDSLAVQTGDTVNVYPVASCPPETYVYLKYTSSNTEVAAVDNDGNITGVSQGAAIITVSTTNGMTDKCLVYVHDENVILRSGVITSNVNCRTEPYDDGGNATLIGTFIKGTSIIVFGEPARTKWYLVAGYNSKGTLMCGYSYGTYFSIGDIFTGDTPVEPQEPVSEELSEEMSETVSEDISEEISEEISQEVSEEISEEPNQDTGLYIGSVSGDLNCRKGPSLDQSSYGVFAKGSTVLVIGEAVNTRWYNCAGMSKSDRFMEGYSGYITSDGKTTYITVIGNFTDTVGKALDINGDTVGGIDPGTTVAALGARMKYAQITVFSPKGNELGSNDTVTTGCTVQFKWCGKTYLTKTAVIKGDINRDGIVDPYDYVELRRYLLGSSTLDIVQLKAADFAGGGSVTVDDYTALRLYLVGQLAGQ